MNILLERRSVEEIEACYDVELDNLGLCNYHGGMGSGIYSVASRWIGREQADTDDEQIHRAVMEMDKYIAWAAPPESTDTEINMNEALAYRAMLAAHWNSQFDGGGHREDDLGPIEAT